jgi:di/tricarboxylate transporter
MDIQIPLLMGTILAALILFSQDRIPADVTALGVLLFLILTGLLPPEKAFSGFGSDVFILVMGLLILMEALSRTGVTDYVGQVLMRRANSGTTQLLLVVMIAAVVVGAFMSNTAATAFFLPIVIGLARNARLSPAKFLMPLAFASILASSITLIGTSTNIVVSGLMTQYGLAPLGMLELTPAGILIAITGVTYMLVLGQRLIPDRVPVEELEDVDQGLFLTELLVPAGSPLAGKTLGGSGLGRELDLKVVRVVRGRRNILPRASTKLKEGDVLLVEGERDNVLGVEEAAGVQIRPDVEFRLSDLAVDEVVLTDVIITPGSLLVGRTLQGLNFRNQYGLQVLAVQRHGQTLKRKLSLVRLRGADVMLVQGEPERIKVLERRGLFRVLGTLEERRTNRRRAPIAVGIFVAVLAASALGLVALPAAMLLGTLLVFATRCITPEEAYRRINWKVLILIACMLGLGVAMEATGTAEFLAAQIVNVLGDAQPIWLLTGFYVLTLLLTQPMSNQAAAAVVLPVAIQTARQLDLNPRSFAIMIALAASSSFLTPLEPACLLVYGPGRYRFSDFVKVGALLTVLAYAISIVMVLLLWPVHPPG